MADSFFLPSIPTICEISVVDHGAKIIRCISAVGCNATLL